MSSKAYMMTNEIIFAVILLLIVSCDGNSDNEFSLSGTTNIIENGSTLYLNIDEFTTVDSVIVENNKFFFKSRLPEFPVPVVLRNEDLTQYRFMWLEKSPMTFEAIETDFKNATVTGSETDKLSLNLIQKLDKLSDTDIKAVEIEFIENNINSILSSYLLSENSSIWGIDKTKELYNRLSNDNKSSKFGREIAEFIQMNEY